MPTELRIQLSALAPWNVDRDRLVVYAPNVGFVQVFAQDGEGISGMPSSAATATTLSVDWAGALAAPLLDAGRGDRAYAMQFRFVQFDQMWVGAPVRATQLAPLTQTNGAQTTTSAALTAETRVDLSLAMDNGAFDALRPAIGKTVGPALAPMTLEAALGRRSAALTEAGPARPLVTAVRAPLIAGRDGYIGQSGVGLTPEIRWDPPATGTATSYRLQIIEGVAHPPEPYRPGWYIAAELMVPGDVTSIRMPADVLRPGATYGVVIRTFAEPGQDVTTRPFQVRGTAGFADTIIGPFMP